MFYKKRKIIAIRKNWNSYSFLDDSHSSYNHSVHIHGQHDLRFWLDSTSHIESIWSILKTELKRIY